MPDTRFDEMLGEVPTMMLVDYMLRKRPQVVAVKMVKMPQGSTIPPADGQEFTLVPAVEPVGQDLYPGEPLDEHESQLEPVRNPLGKKMTLGEARESAIADLEQAEERRAETVIANGKNPILPTDAHEELDRRRAKKENSIPQAPEPTVGQVEDIIDSRKPVAIPVPGVLSETQPGLKPVDFDKINETAPELALNPTPPTPPAEPIEETPPATANPDDQPHQEQAPAGPADASEQVELPSPFETPAEPQPQPNENPIVRVSAQASLRQYGQVLNSLPDGALIQMIEQDGRFESNPTVRASQSYQLLDLNLGNKENSHRAYLMAAASVVLAENEPIRNQVMTDMENAKAE